MPQYLFCNSFLIAEQVEKLRLELKPFIWIVLFDKKGRSYNIIVSVRFYLVMVVVVILMTIL